MAGTRQHFIPRMLLRCFGDTREQVRILRRGGHSFVTSIRNIALENEFYGKPGPGSADESITQEESRIGPMLQAVNSAPEGSIDTTTAAELITHFTIRVRSMRTFMGQATNIALDEIGRQFSDSESLRSLMQDYIRANPDFLVEELHKRVRDDYGVSALAILLQHPLYPSILEFMHNFAEQQICNLDADVVGADMRQAMAYFRSSVGEMVNLAHKKVALSDPTPAKRSEVLASFTFAVQDSSQDLILSDCVGWGLRSSVGVTPLHTLEDDLQMVVMPVSRSRVLLGWRDERPRILPDAISLASVHTCDDFIIAHPDAGDLVRFIDEFGRARAATLAALVAEVCRT